jgi:hypothetical protein
VKRVSTVNGLEEMLPSFPAKGVGVDCIKVIS